MRNKSTAMEKSNSAFSLGVLELKRNQVVRSTQFRRKASLKVRGLKIYYVFDTSCSAVTYSWTC